ncbi:hypothetical protein JW756_01990 [Candidatus Woesearchaeota archaeon]|nr:hypothetical protein [Candidatus Woesearchaeota archaeon]
MESDLEKRTMELAKQVILCSRAGFKEYKEWFADKTKGKNLYTNEIEGAAFAYLLFKRLDYSASAFLFGCPATLRELNDASSSTVSEMICDVSRKVAWHITLKENAKKPFWKRILYDHDSTLRADDVPEERKDAYQATGIRIYDELRLRLKKMYAAFYAEPRKRKCNNGH